MAKVIIKILAEDFKNSNYTNPEDCAIARASKRVFEEDLSVDPSHVWVNGKRYNIPMEDNEKVHHMYHYVKLTEEEAKKHKITRLEPEDFDIELTTN